MCCECDRGYFPKHTNWKINKPPRQQNEKPSNNCLSKKTRSSVHIARHINPVGTAYQTKRFSQIFTQNKQNRNTIYRGSNAHNMTALKHCILLLDNGFYYNCAGKRMPRGWLLYLCKCTRDYRIYCDCANKMLLLWIWR